MPSRATTKEKDAAKTSLLKKRVIVSGGTTGIGRAVVHQLVGLGASVFTFGRHRKELETAMREAPPGPGTLTGCVADQSKLPQVRKVFEQADAHLGGLDILINNAAVGSEDIMEDSDEEAEYIVGSNVLGYIWCSHMALERMLPNRSGHIVNVGSMSAEKRGGSEIYTATKSANRGFSDALRRSCGEKGVRVTLIEPGKTGTDLLEMPVRQQKAAETRLAMLTAEDVAECIIFCLLQPRRVSMARLQVVPMAHQS